MGTRPSAIASTRGGLGEAFSPRSEPALNQQGEIPSCHCSRFLLCYPIYFKETLECWPTYSAHSDS